MPRPIASSGSETLAAEEKNGFLPTKTGSWDFGKSFIDKLYILTYEIAGKIKRSDIPSSIHVRIDGIMNFSTNKDTATIHPIR